MDFQLVIDELMVVINNILAVLPNIINGLLLLLIGVILATVVRVILRVGLRVIGFDALMEQLGFADALRSLRITTPFSRLVSRIVFWLLLLSFAVTATQLMGLGAIADVLNQLLLFLPSIIAALLVFLLGSLAAKYVGDGIAQVGADGGLTFARGLARLIQYLLLLFVVVLALAALGVNIAILVTVVTILVAAFSLAIGLSLGLGARELVRNILSSYYVRERFSVGRTIMLGDVRGEVSGIGVVNTVVTTADEEIVIPNTLLVRSVVRATRRNDTPSSPPTPPPAPPTTPPAV